MLPNRSVAHQVDKARIDANLSGDVARLTRVGSDHANKRFGEFGVSMLLAKAVSLGHAEVVFQ